MVAAGQQAAGARDAGLDLVRDEEHVALLARSDGAGDVVVGRHIHTLLALDGLHEEGADVRVLQRLLQRWDVIVGDHLEARCERPEAALAVGVGAHAHDGDGAAVEVAFTHNDLGLSGGDTLLLIAPLARHLDRRLHRLGAGVHGQHAVIAEERTDRAGVLPEHAVVEGAAGERHARCLLLHHLHQTRVAVTLVHRAVGAEEIVVALALHVPHEHALATVQDHREGVVVVGTVVLLEFDGLLGAGAGGGVYRHGRKDAGRSGRAVKLRVRARRVLMF